MKILYAVQATGNGHISRAMELLPHFKKYGQVDLFLSGQNSTLQLNEPVAYRSRGLSLFYTCRGSLHYGKLVTKFNPLSLYREIGELPVEKYDVVINDFEFITSRACKLKKKPSVHFGHQASFVSDRVPRPDTKSPIGEFILKNYAKGSTYMGLHFKEYDHNILTPVIKDAVYNACPEDKGYFTVYLPSYCDDILEKYLLPLKDFQFQVFSAQKKEIETKLNITFIPVNKTMFDNSLVNCTGIITGAGFETPAEALYLQKKVMAIPIKGQYEQQCNAAALKEMGVITPTGLDDNFNTVFTDWAALPPIEKFNARHAASEIVDKVMVTAFQEEYNQGLDFLYPELVIG